MINNFHLFGMICELNPPHSGHFALIRSQRQSESDCCVAVMSGHFVQRGEPAAFDQWTRTRAALLGGADLVVQLPLPWAVSGAERFALGGVGLLDAMGCVDTLAFGSECGEIAPLEQLADALESPAFADALQQCKASSPGSTFAVLQQQAAAQLLGEQTAALLREPNNTLAIAYCRALRRFGSGIRPVTLQRTGAGYHDAVPAGEGHPSATQLRQLLRDDPKTDLTPYVPEAVLPPLAEAVKAGLAPVASDALEQAILAKLRMMTPAEFAGLPDCSEGIEQKLQQAVRSAVSLEGLYDGVKSKRYAHARIRRLVLSAFLGITAKDGAGLPPYCRILGVSQRGRALLPALKANCRISLILRHRDALELPPAAKRLYDLECRAADLYALAYPRPQSCGLEMRTGLIVLNESDREQM